MALDATTVWRLVKRSIAPAGLTVFTGGTVNLNDGQEKWKLLHITNLAVFVGPTVTKFTKLSG